MPKINFLLNDFTQEATVTSTNEEPDAQASALVNPRTSTRWRTTNLTTMRATIDAGSMLSFDTVFIGYTNATAACTWQITADAVVGNLFTSPTFDTGAILLRLPGTGDFTEWNGIYLDSTTRNFRYMGIEIVDAANPDSYFEAGLLVAGVRFSPAFETELGSSRGYVDTSVPIMMANGETVVRRRPRKRTFSYRWGFLTPADSILLDNVARIYGESTPFVLKEEPEIAAYGQNLMAFGLAQFRDASTISNQAPYGFNSVEMTFTEV